MEIQTPQETEHFKDFTICDRGREYWVYILTHKGMQVYLSPSEVDKMIEYLCFVKRRWRQEQEAQEIESERINRLIDVELVSMEKRDADKKK